MSDDIALSRRALLRLGGAALLGPWGAGYPERVSASAAVDAAQALAWLREGNQRWVSNQLEHPNLGPARRSEQAGGQTPFAIIFSCVDSRVPPELVFDRGVGDLFVIRTAGHVIDAAALGSIEYGVEELHIPLVMVLGHERCGAVAASIETVEANAAAPGFIGALVEGIRPAVAQAHGLAGDLLDNTVRRHIVLTVEALKARSALLREAVDHGHLTIVGARYDLRTGAVDVTTS